MGLDDMIYMNKLADVAKRDDRIAELEGRLEVAETTLSNYDLQYCAFCGGYEPDVLLGVDDEPYCYGCYDEWDYACPEAKCDMRSPEPCECPVHDTEMVWRKGGDS